VFDLLSDGKWLTNLEIYAHVRQLHTVTRPQITSVLSHLKSTNRLLHQDGKWRRKFVRQQHNSISTENMPLPSRSDVVERLDKLAAEGKLQKIEQGNHATYGMNKPVVPSAKQSRW
jgi:hypothetical protein